jgi:hypothetical protein
MSFPQKTNIRTKNQWRKKKVVYIPTYCGHLTFSTMLIILDILNNLQTFGSFLNGRVATTEEKDF